MNTTKNPYTIRDAHGNGCKRIWAIDDSQATATLSEWVAGKMEPDQFYVTREFPRGEADGIV